MLFRSHIDKTPNVQAFVKNASLGFAIPYLHNGQMHDYLPDFIIRLNGGEPRYLILEVKGYDPLDEVKSAAAQRWVNAVNSDNRFGLWSYRLVKRVSDIRQVVNSSDQALRDADETVSLNS